MQQQVTSFIGDDVWRAILAYALTFDGGGRSYCVRVHCARELSRVCRQWRQCIDGGGGEWLMRHRQAFYDASLAFAQHHASAMDGSGSHKHRFQSPGGGWTVNFENFYNAYDDKVAWLVDIADGGYSSVVFKGLTRNRMRALWQCLNVERVLLESSTWTADGSECQFETAQVTHVDVTMFGRPPHAIYNIHCVEDFETGEIRVSILTAKHPGTERDWRISAWMAVAWLHAYECSPANVAQQVDVLCTSRLPRKKQRNIPEFG